MDKVVDKTGLMLGSVRSSLGGSVSAAPLTICTVTVCPREQSSATPHQGTVALRGFQGVTAQNSDSKADSSGVTAAPLTAPPFQG